VIPCARGGTVRQPLGIGDYHTPSGREVPVPPGWGDVRNPPVHWIMDRRVSRIGAGSVVLSHRASPAVPSAQRGLTAVFGMGTGVSPALWPPATSVLVSPANKHGCGERERVSFGVGSAPPVASRRTPGGCGHCTVSHDFLVKHVPEKPGAEEPVKPHGPLVRLGFTSHLASTCRLSTW
jgi:hypothetical protein